MSSTKYWHDCGILTVLASGMRQLAGTLRQLRGTLRQLRGTLRFFLKGRNRSVPVGSRPTARRKNPALIPIRVEFDFPNLFLNITSFDSHRPQSASPMFFPNCLNNRLSRLMLGTVQFGLPYGVANRTGQPDYREVLAIVEAAAAGGINCFDTAAAYGTSEDVLGRALRELGITDNVVVVTKVQPLTVVQLADPALASASIVQSIQRSRQRLQMDCLPIVLFHREVDAAFMDVLAELQTKKWLRYYGVSCDNRPGAAAKFVAAGGVSALQLPANLVDHRHARSGVFEAAASSDVAIFIRSVYLQGLLAMPEGSVPVALQAIIPVRRALERIAAQAGMSLLELAMRYMLSQPGVTSVLTGVETVQQVHDNLAMFSRGPLPQDILAAIHLAVPPLSEILITPSLWPS